MSSALDDRSELRQITEEEEVVPGVSSESVRQEDEEGGQENGDEEHVDELGIVVFSDVSEES